MLRLTDVEIAGHRHDVDLNDPEVVLVDGEYLAQDCPGEIHTIRGAGGALLPGLHDHHLHVLAMAASSVDCAGARDLSQLGAILESAQGRWIRAVGYHESIAGALDRHVLDRLVPDRPVRVQHRSGALWTLNSAALREVAPALDDSADVERDDAGEPTGRLWRYDSRLRPALPPAEPDLGAVGDRLLRLGITGVTDATPDLEMSAVDLLVAAHRDGRLPQRITLLGCPDDFTDAPGVNAGPAKLMLRDHDLPSVDDVAAWVANRHAAGRPVAVHCVTADSLALLLAALQGVGTMPGDRIEHGSVVPYGLRPEIARLGLRVVTNPDFLRTRGEQYRKDVPPSELPFLYPYRSLRDAGIDVAAASDAPFGSADPWQVVRSAAERTTSGGHLLVPEETVTAGVALSGYLSPATHPGGSPRVVGPGAIDGLCLLETPLDTALHAPDADLVRAVIVGGHIRAITRAAARPQ